MHSFARKKAENDCQNRRRPSKEGSKRRKKVWKTGKNGEKTAERPVKEVFVKITKKQHCRNEIIKKACLNQLGYVILLTEQVHWKLQEDVRRQYV